MSRLGKEDRSKGSESLGHDIPSAEKLNKVVPVKVGGRLKEMIEKAARAKGVSVSTWMRNAAVEKISRAWRGGSLNDLEEPRERRLQQT